MALKGDKLKEEYARLAHAIQSGIAYNKDKEIMEPKHLRVGIDLRAVEHGALVALLIDIGIFTEEEYGNKLIEYMKREVKDAEKELSEQYGTKVNLA